MTSLVEPLVQDPGFSEQEVRLRVQAALMDAQNTWEAKTQERQKLQDATLAKVLQSFAQQRATYFREVEADVVQLSLAIARKVLHREAALDPTLLGGLVRVALDRVGGDTAVRIRVAPNAMPLWQAASSREESEGRFTVVPDSTLGAEECVVESNAGTAHFGIEAQLKEIEQSFIDLMARRPGAL